MTKDELRKALHREMLFYYFAQREPQFEIRTGESLMSAVWRKMQPYADCGFLHDIIEADIEMLCNYSFAGLFHYNHEKGTKKIDQLRQKLARLE